jgi:Protein of unknown function (DUF3999)
MNVSNHHKLAGDALKKQGSRAINTILRLLAATLFAHASLANAAESERPDDYALRYTLEARTDTGLQRVDLPAAALAALRTADRADVRVFNANGQAVPLAILPNRAQVVAAAPVSWPIYPINATANEQQNLGGLQLRIEERAGRRTVTVDTSAASKRTAQSSVQVQQIGALVDTKTLNGALENLLIDAEFPVGQPVPITIAASKDLKSWRTIVDSAPVFRFGADTAPSSMSIALSSATLDKEYLRITWPLQQSFVLRGVKIVPASEAKKVARLAMPLTVPAAQSSGEFVINVPFAAPLQALEIRATSANVLAPIHISGRNQRAEPWRGLASGVVYRITTNGAESHNPSIELGGVSVRELRIETQSSASGFGTTLPTVSALVDPVEVAFLANGAAPFTLAVGRSDAKRVALPIASLIPGYAKDAELALPQAKAIEASMDATPPDTSALSGLREKVGAPSNRSLALWAVLLGGVALLGAIAWLIFRQTKIPSTAAESTKDRSDA